MSLPASSTLWPLTVESFRRDGHDLVRLIQRRDGSTAESRMSSSEIGALPDVFDRAWLRSKVRPPSIRSTDVVRVVDLFAGCGGLTVGIAEAARALQLQEQTVLANDIEPPILDIYGRNFPEAELVGAPIETLLDSPCGAPLSATENDLRDRLGHIDLVVGGPPCQGHSDLNNHTRHEDPKNELYLRMARFCEVVRPRHVIIENVPGVLRDRRRVAQRTWERLTDLGYRVDSGTIDASRLGVAQRRKRNVTIASLDVTPSVEGAVRDVETAPRSVTWAISDLHASTSASDAVFDRPPTPTATNERRIDFLFDNALFELPDAERPDCHRLKEHTYVSVYGRLYPDLPAPTITTGFGTMGRGRFVHPHERRMLTPHEAARIQFFPDFFDFGPSSRSLLQTVIGNAVPPKLGYALALHLLR